MSEYDKKTCDENYAAFFDKTNYKNFFKPENNFFIIDSNNIHSIDTKMYGYCVNENGILEDSKYKKEIINDKFRCGAYVLVLANKQEIVIRQDNNGSYGLYCYKENGYFAISNSFHYLLDYLKSKCNLSINHDYAYSFFMDYLGSTSFSDTPINEIELLDKDFIVHIDKKNSTIFFERITNEDGNFRIDSKEGIAILDSWFNKWTRFFCKLFDKTKQINLSLSGGFDSRITFMLVLKSGINIKDILVSSFTDELHTHKEDYEIASSIAGYYGFPLNNNTFKNEKVNYSLEDMLNISLYVKMSANKQMYFRNNFYEEKRFYISGLGGEALRARSKIPFKEYINQKKAKTHRFTSWLAEKAEASITYSLNKTMGKIFSKHPNVNLDSKEFYTYLHRETDCRSHSGKSAVESYLSNVISIMPLIDSQIRMIKPSCLECDDEDLLICLLYIRYCPELLDFKFQGGRSISAKTIEYAKKLNTMYPIRIEDETQNRHDTIFSVCLKDECVSKVIKINNQVVPIEAPKQYLKSVFDTSIFQKTFSIYFNEQIIKFAKSIFENTSHNPMREIYSALAIGKVVEDVVTSNNLSSPSITNSFNHYLRSNNNSSLEELELWERYKDLFTARIEIKLINEDKANMDIINISDFKASIKKPDWFQEKGIGYVIESFIGKIDIKFYIQKKGKLSIRLRGKEVKNNNGERIPFWIDYKLLKINNDIIFDDIKTVWHDKPYYYSVEVDEALVINFVCEWSPSLTKLTVL